MSAFAVAFRRPCYTDGGLANRDEFSAEVIRTLAGRTGYKCSVCGKPTSGPGATDNAVQSDGIAAHITGASSQGPRHDPSLSSQERGSVNNGIWVCTQHGREIDSVLSNYPVGILRGLKALREARAKRELQTNSTREDPSAILVDLPNADTPERLVKIIAPQEYTFRTTLSVRSIVHASQRGRRVLGLVPEVIIGVSNFQPDVAGILATLLSASLEYWNPAPKVLTKLEHLCSAVIDSDEWHRVALVEPLAFAISAKGRPDAHREVLRRLVKTTKWRDADINRQRTYYGSTGAEIAAVMRHWDHRYYRKGLLRANDVGRLMGLVLSESLPLKDPQAKNLTNLLRSHARVLSAHGERELANSVADFAAGVGSSAAR